LQQIITYLKAYSRRKHVRPWSLSAPIIVLLICLPLLSPLRHPLKSQMSDEEMARWATVQALVEHQTFAIDGTDFSDTHQRLKVADVSFSNQPPTQGLLLAGPYWVLHWFGITFSKRPQLVEYLLTMLGVTIPVAAAAGMLYRMARLFELRRPRRAALALLVVLGSGMISYATILNPYAPAAALVLGSAAILVQVSLVRSPLRSGGYLTAAGFFAALAAAIYPAAVVFTILFVGVILVMRWRPSLRIGGVLMYCIGMVPPVLLHMTLSGPVTGDWRLGLEASPDTSLQRATGRELSTEDDGSISGPPTASQALWSFLSRLTGAFLGSHGILSHFPILIFGMIGVASVMHRHWPPTTKMFAVATTAGAMIVIVRYVWLPMDWRGAMFSCRWFVVFLPLMLFWSGAWLRKSHHPATWAVAAVLLTFSVVVSLVGATDPMPRDGYSVYTVVGATRNLIKGNAD
jgi:MFS family permease